MISDFLKPPTDNLYKFMCISGLILVLLSLTLPAWLLNKVRYSYLENKRDLEILQVDSEMANDQSEILTGQVETLNKDREYLLKQMESLRSEVASKSPLNRADNLIVEEQLANLKGVQGELEKKDQEWLEKMMAVLSTKAEQRKKLLEIKYKNEAALWDSRNGIAISVLALFTGAFGFWIGRKGFNLWSLRVQVYQDAILKKQAEETAK